MQCTKSVCAGSGMRTQKWDMSKNKGSCHIQPQHVQKMNIRWCDHSLRPILMMCCAVKPTCHLQTLGLMVESFWMSHCDLKTKDTLSRGWMSPGALLLGEPSVNTFWQTHTQTSTTPCHPPVQTVQCRAAFIQVCIKNSFPTVHPEWRCHRHYSFYWACQVQWVHPQQLW